MEQIFFLCSSISVSAAFFFAARFVCSRYFSTYKANPHDLHEATNKVISGLHAIFSTVASLIVIVSDQSRIGSSETRMFGASELCQYCIALSCGYFLYDLLHLYLDTISQHSSFQKLVNDADFRQRKLPYLIHHFACFVVYFLCLCKLFGMLYLCGFLLWELSTPLLNLRWFLLKFGDPNSKLVKHISILFAVTFFLARIVFGTWLTFHLWVDMFPLYSRPDVDHSFLTILLGCSTALSLLNLFWFGQIVQMALGNKAKSH
eukprot:TRINITY_DN4721_c0_g2_i3.p1 TRINITY_DN4721_c0_g2~~TRINITY_DN4721_c0_g2_i3.p1  ORF type:complete len:290 (-),score=42.28 TRINITY_DN4721_c0_g2_i3:83-865(-)